MILGTKLNSKELHDRLANVIEDFDVMKLFSDASVELGSDLVVFCDVETSQTGVMLRSEFIEEYLKDPDSEQGLWDELTGPANGHLPNDGLSQLAFWLIVAFSEEETYCTAVGAYLMTPGGEA